MEKHMHLVRSGSAGAPRGAQAKVIAEKYNKAIALTDHEVIFGAQFYRQLTSELLQCGEVFLLARQEADRLARGLEDIKSARNI